VAWQSRVSILMCHTKNGTNHEETSCEMNRFVDKTYRAFLRVVMHLRERLIQGRLFVRAGFYKSFALS